MTKPMWIVLFDLGAEDGPSAVKVRAKDPKDAEARATRALVAAGETVRKVFYAFRLSALAEVA